MSERYSEIVGVGSAFPERVMTNKDFEKFLDTSDEWIKTRTGIERRHIADPKKGESTLSIAEAASRKALKQAGVDPADLDAIIVGTITPESVMPSTGVWLQKNLGANKAFAFDLQASCAGFLYALSVANNFIRSGQAKKILVIGADTLSNIVDWHDRSTCVLFGDGAGAVVLTETDSKSSRLLGVDLYSDGRYSEELKVAHGYSKVPPYHPDYQVSQHAIKMKGSEVFKVAVRSMVSASEKILNDNGLGIEDVNLFLFHQANKRIIDMCVKTLDLNPEKVWINVDRYGNTSAATIPVCLDEAWSTNSTKKGDVILMASFGGGFAWGSGVMKL